MNNLGELRLDRGTSDEDEAESCKYSNVMLE